MRTLVTGATGLIGRRLVGRLDDVVVLTRDPASAQGLGATGVFAWSPEAGAPPAEATREVDVVFNLAGEPVADGRWTAERKRRIRDSRVIGTRNLVAALAASAQRPKVLVSASAVGYYGDAGDDPVDERSQAGRDFLAEVCVAWEHEALAAERLGIRVVCVRTGFVLAPGGGALAKMLPPFRMGMGARVGSGEQWTPWIHIDDVVGIMIHASQDERVRGPINAVAPTPATNAAFTRELGQALHRPAVLAVPRTALRLMFGEMSQVLTASQHVLPSVAERTGYAFKYPELGPALVAVLAELG
jgi:uncharacterized protein (TIGR01777 family)